MSTAAPARAPLPLGLHPASIRRVGRVLLTVGCFASVLEAALSFVLAPLRGVFGGQFEDFEAYFLGGRAVADGADAYASFDAGTITMSGFDYPPLAAWLVRPIMVLPHQWAATLWLWIALAALIAGAVVTARSLLPPTWPGTRLAVLAALTFPPATYNLWHGQMNSVIFLLVALALRDYVAGREVRCGVLIGMAAAVKVSPALLVLLLIRRGWFRGAAAATATGVASLAAGAILLGPSATRAWLTEVLPVLSRDNGWIYNQTWNGVVNRLADHSVLTVQPAWGAARALTLGLGAVTLMVALAWVSRQERTPPERGAEFGAALTAMLLVGTVAWYPHYIHLLIPLASAAGLVAARGVRTTRVLIGAAAVCAVTFGVLAAVAIAQLPMSTIVAIHGGAGWWPFLQATSLPALAAAGLLAATAASLRRAEPPASEEPGVERRRRCIHPDSADSSSACAVLAQVPRGTRAAVLRASASEPASAAHPRRRATPGS